MGFIKLTCPNCGAAMDLDENREFGFCSYCGTKVVQDKIVIEHKGTVSISGIANEKSILKRMFIFLEDKDWNNADIYADKVLDINPQNSYAYIGKLMLSLKISKFENLQNSSKTFDKNGNYIKAIRFGDKKLIDALQKYNDVIKSRLEQERKERIYQSALNDAKTANNYVLYEAVSKKFATLGDYKDANKYSEKYKAIAYNEREKQKHKNKVKKVLILVFVIFIIFIILLSTLIIPSINYKKANSLLNSGNYSEAYNLYRKNKYFSNSTNKADSILSAHFEVAHIGDTISFGNFFQTNTKTKEPIEWIVYNIENSKLYLISKNIIYADEFNKSSNNIFDISDKDESLKWDKSSIRKWLNKDFFNNSFNEKEKKKITEVKNITNNKADLKDTYKKEYEITTYDKIFLLSENEYMKYKSIITIPQGTNYATERFLYEKHACEYWFLRSRNSEYPEYISIVGQTKEISHTEARNIWGIRPTIVLDISHENQDKTNS